MFHCYMSFFGGVNPLNVSFPASHISFQGGKGFLSLAIAQTPKNHQTFQVPKIVVLTYISRMDTAYVREDPGNSRK